jgi:DNA-binding transcriptional MerR regulator
MSAMKIGVLAHRTGTNAPTIRYYEEIGLLRSANRQAGGQRVYGDADVKQLTFIRRCREFGFSIDQVRSLVKLMQDPSLSCMHARDLAHEHLVAVRTKLAELKALKRSIAAFVASCDASCAGRPGPDCVILDDFSKGRTARSKSSSKSSAQRSNCSARS